MRLSFSVDDTAVMKKLDGLLGGVKDLRKPFTEAGDDLLTFFGEDVFESQARAIGDSWRALAESTLRARADRKGHYARTPERTDKILWWTGDLKRGFRKEANQLFLRIYNDVEYFRYHQERGGSPPQRKMLAITSNVILKVMDRLIAYVERI